MKNKKNLFILIILIFLIIPFFWLSFFIHPSADDYSFSHIIKVCGRWAYQVSMYNHWSGRYFANLIFSLNPLTFDSFGGYKIFALLLLTAFVLSAIYFAYAILKGRSNFTETVVAALLLTVVYLDIIPSPAETIYWMTGSIEYFLPCILILIFLAAVITGLRKENKNWKYIFIAGLAGFCTCGCNEISLIFILEITILIFILNLWNRHILRFILPVLIVVFISSLFDIIAPGNYARMLNYPNAHNIVYSLEVSCISLIKLAGIHLKSPPFIILTVLSLPVLSIINSKIEKSLISINPWQACGVAVFIFISIFFPVAYSTGFPSPLRIYNTASAMFMLAWFYLIYLFIHHYSFSIQYPKLMQALMLCAYIIFIAGGFYKVPGKEIHFSGNVAQAFYDAAFGAKTYNDEMNERYSIIENSKQAGKLSVSVPALPVKPSSIYFIDISDDTTSWINNGTAQYFGLSSIRSIPEKK